MTLRQEAMFKGTERKTGHPQDSGFTLLELAVVMLILITLAAITVPAYHVAIQRSKEAVLRDDLHTMRSVLDEYTVDKEQPPQSLQDLVDGGYMHAIPADPMTGSTDTWVPDIKEVPVPPDQTATGVVDVHSGSEDKALDGTAYNAW